ncbi:MAG: hypothetical protein HYW49_03325 [Deltaproteobacteria bacterium]|nr:hypothetical protein [Deltaproteobacteria bacterium]
MLKGVFASQAILAHEKGVVRQHHQLTHPHKYQIELSFSKFLNVEFPKSAPNSMGPDAH